MRGPRRLPIGMAAGKIASVPSLRGRASPHRLLADPLVQIAVRRCDGAACFALFPHSPVRLADGFLPPAGAPRRFFRQLCAREMRHSFVAPDGCRDTHGCRMQAAHPPLARYRNDEFAIILRRVNSRLDARWRPPTRRACRDEQDFGVSLRLVRALPRSFATQIFGSNRAD